VVYLKREDLCHTGAHKINNAIGQALIARRLGVTRIVAETGAGQHGVAAAAAAARIGLPCTVYMGSVDVVRQRSNVERMKLLGATVIPVDKGDKTLRAAIDEAMREWVSDPEGTYYLIGSVVGPHPYPTLVAELQSVIGHEARSQMLELAGDLPDVAVACVGGGSNAIGMFRGFVDDESVSLLGVEAGGDGNAHSATLGRGTLGVLHGAMTPLLQDEHGQVLETHSIAPGLDYPGVGPEHAMLRDSGRATYMSADDAEALSALRECATKEGIIPALESAHALAGARSWAADNPGATIAICVSGRGDKDLDIIRETSDE
jgi:tryptophan synthase beta subunit